MPSFCRHNRLLQRCAICSREQNLELRPIVTGGASSVEHSAASARPRADSDVVPKGRPVRPAKQQARNSGRDVRVRRLAREVDDGFRCDLLPGLRSSEDARRLAEEIAFSARRLTVIAAPPGGRWGELADATVDVEERSWLAFLIAYIGADDSAQPFGMIEAARTSWASGAQPLWAGVRAGPRGAFETERSATTVAAYRAWAQRAGSQQVAFSGEPSWTAERRFERVYERLALPGLSRDARFELLVLLGRAEVYELRAGTLQLGGENEATWAAKRALGIGDPLLLERRAAEFADACGTPLEALDLAFHNWGSGIRSGAGLPVDTAPDGAVLARVQDALGL